MNGNWVVNMTCTVVKEVICENCTEEEARLNPFDFAVDERELYQSGWDVNEVYPND
jgi:hypothetical protein